MVRWLKTVVAGTLAVNNEGNRWPKRQGDREGNQKRIVGDVSTLSESAGTRVRNWPRDEHRKATLEILVTANH